MQFNSFIFLLLYLPSSVAVYFLVNKIRPEAGRMILAIEGAVFYSFAGMQNCMILLASVLVNLLFSYLLGKDQDHKKPVFVTAVAVNIGLLIYYKYLDFFLENLYGLAGRNYTYRNIILPLAISFYTFQQISFLYYSYRSTDKVSPVDHLSYVLYYPKLIMGPLMSPEDYLEQMDDSKKKKIDWDNVMYGVKILSFGLFKKIMIADVMVEAVAWGFTELPDITQGSSLDWLLIMLFYSFEIYFDFSGYCDMATGISLMFNIVLPVNFDSPYRALSIRDFWKRWHISLTGFFTKHLYIPMGGNRKGKLRTYLNSMAVFLISGLWHGANWTFVLWGALHGALYVFDRISENIEKHIYKGIRLVGTFFAVSVLWLLFRADSVSQWAGILRRIISMDNISISTDLMECFLLPEMPFIEAMLHLRGLSARIAGLWMWVYLIAAAVICLLPQNNYKKLRDNNLMTTLLAAAAFIWCLISLGNESVFVYYGF